MGKRIVDIDTYMPVLQELLAQGKQVSLVITGNSMSPFLVHGRDEILIVAPHGKWKKGDMAFFQRTDGHYVMHRIVKCVSDKEYFFVGDGQQVIEGPIASAQIFGKIVSVKRKGRWIGPGNFWWEFFEHVWLRMIPFRRVVCKVYGLLTFWKHK